MRGRTGASEPRASQTRWAQTEISRRPAIGSVPGAQRGKAPEGVEHGVVPRARGSYAIQSGEHALPEELLVGESLDALNRSTRTADSSSGRRIQKVGSEERGVRAATGRELQGADTRSSRGGSRFPGASSSSSSSPAVRSETLRIFSATRATRCARDRPRQSPAPPTRRHVRTTGVAARSPSGSPPPPA